MASCRSCPFVLSLDASPKRRADGARRLRWIDSHPTGSARDPLLRSCFSSMAYQTIDIDLYWDSTSMPSASNVKVEPVPIHSLPARSNRRQSCREAAAGVGPGRPAWSSGAPRESRSHPSCGAIAIGRCQERERVKRQGAMVESLSSPSSPWAAEHLESGRGRRRRCRLGSRNGARWIARCGR